MFLTTNNQQPTTSNLQPPTSNLKPPTSNFHPLTSNLQPPTSNLQHLAWAWAWASNGASGGSLNCRSFDQIIEEEKKNQNIIEIHLSKLPTSDDQIVKNLTFDELGELLFDELKIKPSDCVSLDYNTGRYDTKHVQLKPNVTADQFVTPIPIRFKGHEVTVNKQLNNITRVTFRNVPLNVPNEEIIHLCKSYGHPVDYICLLYTSDAADE